MEFVPLTAISPLDGRYRHKLEDLAGYFSEFALIKYRIYVEIEYFIALCRIPLPGLDTVKKDVFPLLQGIYMDFSMAEALEVKNFESSVNHDVKAVEYFLRRKFVQMGLEPYKEFIHFGLTSQDINNTAVPALLRDAIHILYEPLLEKVISKLEALSREYEQVSMLARTHGQPASPTRLGKEIRVFHERLQKQYSQLKTIPFSAKFGGATGNFNAHAVAYPGVDWIRFANTFVNQTLGLERSLTTTQIEHYDNLAALFDNMKRINTILIDLTRDFWTYISLDYFSQRIRKEEVGSTAMPHKVNPIDFENAEGNLGYANAIFEHLSAKLPVSRLQRDLTDSTVLRNIGVPVAHTILAFQSALKGLDKIIVNREVIQADLENNWSVVAEAIQTVLRREGYHDPYETLKNLTRTNKKITREAIHAFIDSLQVSPSVKQELKAIEPGHYTGV